MKAAQPNLLVLSVLFPSSVQPTAGLFIRERMFRVGRRIPIRVVSPQPWFPLQGLIRLFKPEYRPVLPREELQQGFKVYYPRFFSLPGLLRQLDGFFIALACYRLAKRLHHEEGVNLIDAHFAYPDGYAATLLGKWLKLPVTITLRGSEVPLSKDRARLVRMQQAVMRADQIFSVSESLRRHMAGLGADAGKIEVVGNGVDTDKFFPVDRATARSELGIPEIAKVMITVGGLVERKGFHRVIELMPILQKRFPNLMYLVVGGASAEGDWTERLKKQVVELGLEESVRFLGVLSPEELHKPLSAADLFVLSTRNEGWANVFLEAMACGLPVVTTDVGGNREVVCRDELGQVVPFNDSEALQQAIEEVLVSERSRKTTIEYAQDNSWDSRVEKLEQIFQTLINSENNEENIVV